MHYRTFSIGFPNLDPMEVCFGSSLISSNSDSGMLYSRDSYSKFLTYLFKKDYLLAYSFILDRTFERTVNLTSLDGL